ncbi:PD-(D/E)XK nuclease family protein [Bacteroides propionicifaciens]|uniref:PDDEXK-like family protein n=1 Tax=Bacteroides propionicifaciens TaxID=392838 RepID=UPI00037B75DF|nr:PD-(D/E)XK nuclease family protein [Bacteroides propionicifaciens]
MSTNNDKIQNFLSKLSVIDYKYRVLEEGEERFNIFTALHKVNDEVRLFSRFLSVLLSPQGSHKRKDQFLKLFLETLAIEDFDTKQCEVYPTEQNKSEYKNIDILIINRIRKQAIIVENKIWAGDSNGFESGQLERYYNLIHQEENIPKENIKVFYLSPDKREPSDESLGVYKTLDNMNGATIGYGSEILTWLNLCLKECISTPFLRESILQFIELIEDMTNNNSKIEERLEIKNLIGYSVDNMKSAKLLTDNFKHVKWHTVSEFWNELADALKLKGYEVISQPTDSDISNTTHYEPYKHGYESSNDYGIDFKSTNGLTLYVWNGTGDYWLYWGVKKSKDVEEKIISAINISSNLFKHTETDLWKEFNLEEHENIFFPDFSYEGTFNLIDKDYRTRIITEKLIPEIDNFVSSIQTPSYKVF